MIHVNIYLVTGPNPMDWILKGKNKPFKSLQTAENFCKYYAENIYKCSGTYKPIIIK